VDVNEIIIRPTRQEFWSRASHESRSTLNGIRLNGWTGTRAGELNHIRRSTGKPLLLIHGLAGS
jgi:hypothetical protein